MQKEFQVLLQKYQAQSSAQNVNPDNIVEDETKRDDEGTVEGEVIDAGK
jgi:hypothetical protein